MKYPRGCIWRYDLLYNSRDKTGFAIRPGVAAKRLWSRDNDITGKTPDVERKGPARLREKYSEYMQKQRGSKLTLVAGDGFM